MVNFCSRGVAMAHFEIDFHDKNSERYMLSGRINQILRDLEEKFIVADSIGTGDFLFRDGQYSIDEINEGEWTSFKAGEDFWGYHECYCWFKQTIKIPEEFKGQHVVYTLKPYERSWNEVDPQSIAFAK